MATEKGRPLPKFGEWDVNNPAAAEGFTVIFAKARNEKKSSGTPSRAPAQSTTPQNQGKKPVQTYEDPTIVGQRYEELGGNRRIPDIGDSGTSQDSVSP